MKSNLRNEIKAYIVRSGCTMQEVVDLLSDEHGWSDSVSNLSNKLQRESLRYTEAVQLADALGVRHCVATPRQTVTLVPIANSALFVMGSQRKSSALSLTPKSCGPMQGRNSSGWIWKSGGADFLYPAAGIAMPAIPLGEPTALCSPSG